MNSNSKRASCRDLSIARDAGGLTWRELIRLHRPSSEDEIHRFWWHDALTDYWIPKGVFLFRKAG